MRKPLYLLAILALCAGGCISARVKTGTGASVSVVAPAYPWQDPSAALQRALVTQRTNGTSSISLAGLSEEAKTTTNGIELVRMVVGAAVEAAVKGVKP